MRTPKRISYLQSIRYHRTAPKLPGHIGPTWLPPVWRRISSAFWTCLTLARLIKRLPFSGVGSSISTWCNIPYYTGSSKDEMRIIADDQPSRRPYLQLLSDQH